MTVRRAGITLAGIVVAVTALEALAYARGGVFEWAAARLWLVMGLGFVALAIRVIGAEVAEAARRRSLLALVMVAVVGYAALSEIGGVDHVQIQHEAPIEVDIGLDAWAAPGLDYAAAAYRGYPARQYLIVAAPAVVMGRSLLALRLGFAIVVVLGALIFWAATARAWGSLAGGRDTAALLTIAVFSFPYVIKHLHWYEQTTLPLAFTLAASGWLLLAVDRPTVPNLLGLVWIGSLLGASYTPALGSWCLLLGTLAWLCWRRLADDRRDLAWCYGIVAAAVAVPGGLSFLVRDDLIRSNIEAFRPNPVEAVGEVLSIFVLGSPAAFIAPVLVLPVLTTLLLGCAGRLGAPGLAISWWTIAIVAASTVLAGGGVGDPRFEIHRAQVVVPPVLLLMGFATIKLGGNGLGRRSARSVVVVVCLLVTAQAVWTTRSSYEHFRPTFRELVVERLTDDFAARRLAGSERVVVELQTDDMYLLNLGDILRYFLTDFEIVTKPDAALERSADADLVVFVAGPNPADRDLPGFVEPDVVDTVRIVQHDRVLEVLVAIAPGRAPVDPA